MNCKTCNACYEPGHLQLLICERTLEVITKEQDIFKRVITPPEWCPKKAKEVVLLSDGEFYCLKS